MIKNELFVGSWLSYQKELKKHITEDVIHKNWYHFLECYQIGAMPCRAVKWL